MKLEFGWEGVPRGSGHVEVRCMRKEDESEEEEEECTGQLGMRKGKARWKVVSFIQHQSKWTLGRNSSKG